MGITGNSESIYDAKAFNPMDASLAVGDGHFTLAHAAAATGVVGGFGVLFDEGIQLGV
ncbi:hypothetical protein HORIV_29620 [Vreelandella olivaria]|uniref:Uncharacterized protein n=1 Tax=Vreelandella olivaria TaxID=390919 RepID=A0ABN5WUB0_9GAMM|nr:hypothetical protein HORIV_29620 [Halomonas olivaria]